MKAGRVIEILTTEFSCVTAADNGCDRDCGKCRLVMESEDIREALRVSIAAMHTLKRIKENCELGIRDTEVNWMHYGYPSESRKAYQKVLDCISDDVKLHNVFDEAPE